jgi:haloalkane dehalogenase
MKHVAVLGTDMAYREAGEDKGPVALFLHGNPTSSYIWRDVIPHVAGIARCIAPDLVGFGQSGKPPIEYRFVDHVRYLDRFIDALGLRDLYLVAQDWGTALALHFAARFPERVCGLAFMEFIGPMPTWNDFHQSDVARATFQKFRTSGEGEALILEANVFVERILPGSIVRTLTDDEMQAYRAPFPTPESRRPIWRFANELPIGGRPSDVWDMMDRAHRALAESIYPKLLFVGDPGALVSPRVAEQLATTLTRCRVVQLGAGKHYLQEDHPKTIGGEVAHFIRSTEDTSRHRGSLNSVGVHSDPSRP